MAPIPTPMAESFDRTQELLNAVAACYERMHAVTAWPDERLLKRVDTISAWSVAQQLDHTAAATALMLTAIDRICAEKAPAENGGSINIAGRAVLRAGRMPRGKAQAPARVVPQDDIDRAHAERTLARSEHVYQKIRQSAEAVTAATWKTKHPYLGMLDARQWLRLADVHAQHHFKIIDDIDAA